MTVARATAVAAALPHPRLTIDTGAVGRNVRTIARAAGVPVMAVVKADGFGGGAQRTARAALAAGASWIGTATLDEAVALRRTGLAAPLLAWVLPVDADWANALRLRIDLGIASVEHLRAVAAAAGSTGGLARVHLHVDCGMARDGAPAAQWRRLVRAAAATRSVEVVGVMGHLPCADEPGHPSTEAGIRTFTAAVDAVRTAGLQPALRHLAATEAALRVPEARFDLVRIGGGLHGIGPGLEPSATWTAPVTAVRRVRAGTPVGYGHTVAVTRDTVLATLPVGYADGVPRTLDPGAAVQLDGRRCRVVGRVSMDQTIVDTGPRGVRLGAEAMLFGSGAAGEPVVGDWARWGGTIERDVLTGIGARVERVSA